MRLLFLICDTVLGSVISPDNQDTVLGTVNLHFGHVALSQLCEIIHEHVKCPGEGVRLSFGYVALPEEWRTVVMDM